MRLTYELAEKIVENTMNVLGKNINIMDNNGMIIASGNKERINTFHEVALEVINTGHNIIIKEEEIKRYKGVKAGINLPVKFNTKIIGVVGITGKVTDVSGYGEIVKNMVELIVQREFLRNEIELENKFKENLFQQLLSNSINDKEQLKDRLQLLEIEDGIPRVIIILRIQPFERINISNKIEEICKFSFLVNEKDIMIIRGENIVLIKTLPGNNNQKKLFKITEKLELELKKEIDDFVIGVGDIITEIEQLYMSYKGAKLAINIGQKIYCDQEEKVFSINHLGYDYLLPYIEKGQTERYLHYLFKQDPRNIFEDTDAGKILDALVANDLNVSKASDDLYIHRNTLLYKLDKIKETIGLDLKNAKDLFSLLIAYHLFLYSKK